jgi:hypothetical protein
MDKPTFDKEILGHVKPNYPLGIFSAATDDRAATLKNLQIAGQRYEAKADILYLYSFASLCRVSLSSAMTHSMDKTAPGLVQTCNDWFDQTQNLISRVNAVRQLVGQTGVLKDSLNYLSRR